MIGIADPKLWNLGVGLLSKWNGLPFYLLFIFIVNKGIITYSMPVPNQHIFFVLRPVTLRLGRIAEQVQVLVA